MKVTFGLAAVLSVLFTIGCNVDSGPTLTASDQIDAGQAESVQTEVHMSAGTLRMEGGAPNLMAASFRYSEKFGRPSVRYDVTGAHGRLVVESPKSNSNGGKVNEWDLRMGSEVPLDVNVSLGAGESTLDMSQIRLRSMEVNAGAGEMTLNLTGKYTRDVSVQVNGGVGEARIRLPKDVGTVVDAHGGIGSIDTKGLTKRDGKYYNDAYAEGKPALHLEVQGGVGEIVLTVGE